MKAQLRAMPSATLCTMVFPSTSQGRSNGGLFLSVSYVHMYLVQVMQNQNEVFFLFVTAKWTKVFFK